MKIQKVMIALGAVLLSGSAYGAQILSNPDFETGAVAPWLNDNSIQSGSWTITTTGCHTGVYCVTDNGDVGLYQTFVVNTATITAANFWVKPTNGIVIALFYSGGAPSPDYIMFNPTAGQLNVWDNVDLLGSLRSNAWLT